MTTDESVEEAHVELKFRLPWHAPMLTVLLVVCVPATSLAQDGIRLFHKMQNALGGAEKIDAIRDIDECVRADTWDNDGKPDGVVFKRTRWIRPNVLRLDQSGPHSYVLYFDGLSGWEILPDKGLVELAGDELAFARGYLSGMDLTSWLANRDSRNAFSIPAPSVVAISNKDDSSHKTEITVDPVTFLPTEETSISLGGATGPVATRTRRFEGWATFQGVKFPQRIINFHNGKRVAEIKLQTIRLDSNLRTLDLSVRPQGLNPNMFHCGK